MTDVWNPVTHKQLHDYKLNRAQEDRRWCAEQETVKGHRRTWKDMDNSNKAAQRQLWSAMHARTEEKWEGSCCREDDVGKDETRRRRKWPLMPGSESQTNPRGEEESYEEGEVIQSYHSSGLGRGQLY